MLDTYIYVYIHSNLCMKFEGLGMLDVFTGVVMIMHPRTCAMFEVFEVFVQLYVCLCIELGYMSIMLMLRNSTGLPKYGRRFIDCICMRICSHAYYVILFQVPYQRIAKRKLLNCKLVNALSWILPPPWGSHQLLQYRFRV